jgi:transglutaminase-like putative cysteine protease
MNIPAAALASGTLIDSDHPAVIDFAHRIADGAADDRDKAVRLYAAVRDGFRYDPYTVDLSPAGLRASSVLQRNRGWCVTKAALLAAACRVVGVPARVGYADVRNHLSTERLREMMETDEFYWHGYTSILLDGQWLKATPSFNIELCHRMRIAPLDFDGRSDAVMHPFDETGQRHMEYLRFRGEYDDVPLGEIRATFDACYPKLKRMDAGSDFDSDVAAENPERL